MRVLRTIGGASLLLVAVALLVVGGLLWVALDHRDADGGFTATLEPIGASSGYAVVVPDVDALLAREASFVRGGDTGLRLTASTPDGPVFVGLAPADAVRGYLADVPHTQVLDVKLTKGDLPVRSAPVGGRNAPPTKPAAQRFWVAKAAEHESIEWYPSAMKGQHVALVVMNPEANRPVQVRLTATATVGWLPSTVGGVLVLGAVLFLLGLLVVCWPARPREIVYVVEPSQLPDVAAHLGNRPGPRAVEATTNRFALPPVPSTAPVAGLVNGAWPLPPATPPKPAAKEPARVLPPRPAVTLELDWPPRADKKSRTDKT